MSNIFLKRVSIFLNIILFCMLGIATIIFLLLLVDSFGDCLSSKRLITAICVSLVSFSIILLIALSNTENKFAYKLCVLAVVFMLLTSISLYLLNKFELLDKFDSVEDFREYVSKFGGLTVFVFITIQYLQVVVLPLPSFITISAGVLLFGPLKCALISFIGIYLGTLTAFFIGKRFGVKVVGWLVGRDKLTRFLDRIGDKNKSLITTMFLFPFFPDDMLCFVSGLTSIETKYFIIMTFFTRTLSIFTSCFSINNNLIPYNTWWGILIWIAFIFTVFIVVFRINKRSKPIEKTKKMKN